MSLFKQLYNASEDALKRMKAPIAERKVKRKFQTGFDNGISDILDNTNEIQKMLEDVENLDITKLVNLMRESNDITETIITLSDLHNKLFGTPLDTDSIPKNPLDTIQEMIGSDSETL